MTILKIDGFKRKKLTNQINSTVKLKKKMRGRDLGWGRRPGRDRRRRPCRHLPALPSNWLVATDTPTANRTQTLRIHRSTSSFSVTTSSPSPNCDRTDGTGRRSSGAVPESMVPMPIRVADSIDCPFLVEFELIRLNWIN